MSHDDAVHSISRRRLLEATAAGALVAGTLVVGVALAAPAATTTVAQHVVARLRQHGADRLFGVPGATCDPLFAAAEAVHMPIVVTSSDLEAGYAADGYARLGGLSALAVTYGVGTMALLSVIAGAHAERSAIVVVNGGPSPEDLRIQRELGSLYSHSTGRDGSDLVMFREVTVFAERIERAGDVPATVDAALRAALLHRRPVYLEVPKHLWSASVAAVGDPLKVTAPDGDAGPIAAAVLAKLGAAARPVVLVGAEVGRYGLGDEITALLARLQLPYATTFLGKSVIAEDTPGFLGVYSGPKAVPAVRKAIEGADAVLAIGCILGRQYRTLVTEHGAGLLRITAEGARLGSGPVQTAGLQPMLAALRAAPWQPKPGLAGSPLKGLSFDERRASVVAQPKTAPTERGIGFDELLRAVSGALDEDFVVLTDTSLSMAPAAELNVPTRNGFLCNGVWQAIGWSVGAATGVAMASGKRPLVICGDGGFQMTVQSLSTLARHNIRAIVVVLDNGHYGIEQWLLEPGYFDKPTASVRPYLGLNRWDYAAVARAMGVPHVATVDTLSGFQDALAAAKGTAGTALISAAIRPHDLPAGYRGAA